MASELSHINLFWKYLSHVYAPNNVVPPTALKSLVEDDPWMNCTTAAMSAHPSILHRRAAGRGPAVGTSTTNKLGVQTLNENK